MMKLEQNKKTDELSNFDSKTNIISHKFSKSNSKASEDHE